MEEVKAGMAPGKSKRTRKADRSRGKNAKLRPIGVIRSTIMSRSEAPKQGHEGAPDAWLEVHPFAADALDGMAEGCTSSQASGAPSCPCLGASLRLMIVERITP